MRKTLATILLLPALALAQTSFQTIGYQGLLKRSDGTPETQTVQVTFRIYDAVTGGTELWSEVQEVTPNSGGFYAVFLGSKNAFTNATRQPLFDGSDLYLELQIQGDSTALTPRQQIGSVPYALTAKNVNGGTSGTVNTGNVAATNVAISGAISVPIPMAAEQAARRDMAGQDGMVTTAKIADGNVTRPKLAPVGQQVSAGVNHSTTLGGPGAPWSDVPGASVTLTTTGRPVVIILQPAISGTGTSLNSDIPADGMNLAIKRDGTVILSTYLKSEVPGGLMMMDPEPSATSHTYQLAIRPVINGQSARVFGVSLVAYEM